MSSTIIRAVLTSTAAAGIGFAQAQAQSTAPPARQTSQSASPTSAAQPTEARPAGDATLPAVVVVQQKKEAAPATKPKAAPKVGTDDETPRSAQKIKPKAMSAAPAPTTASEAPLSEAEPVVPTSIAVGGQGMGVPAASSTLAGEAIASQRPATSDTATLLSRTPGVSIFQAGGVSSLPAINGLADDRVKILLNGMAVTSACGNHMNPPLSYSDPAIVGAIEVAGGVAPVSKGGDNIAGTIIVEPTLPRFAAAGQAARLVGQVSGFYRSNNQGIGTAATAEAATQTFSMRYDGTWSTGDDYRRGGDGKLVRSTDYEARNHAVTLAARSGADLFTVRAAIQQIPYQGFVNQRMDMGDSSGDVLGNEARQFNARYRGQVGAAFVDATAFYHDVKHYMNFLTDKGGSTPTTGMPMLTDGGDFGYGIKVELPITADSKLRIGNELHIQRYDEWWPGTMMVPGMGPNTYWNIRDGVRDRLGTFAEWEARWSSALTTLVGARSDLVWMNAGDVQGYCDAKTPKCAAMTSYIADSAHFNAQPHDKLDVNVDLTGLARYQPDAGSTYELGYARKTRSPSLYERYAWSKGNTNPAWMSANMIGWFGDANGYIGNLDLKPEIANTASFTAGWQGKDWETKITPYYTYVQDFIDVDKVWDETGKFNGFVALKFANHDAELYGVNISARARIAESASLGTISVAATAGYVHGRRVETGGSLYHIMPLNGRLAIEERLALFGGSWTNTIEVQAVDAKTDIDVIRNEPTTPAYALLNLRSSYEIGDVRFDLGVENLLDKLYFAPLGGVDFADFKAEGGKIGPVPGMGRSINAGLTVKF